MTVFPELTYGTVVNSITELQALRAKSKEADFVTSAEHCELLDTHCKVVLQGYRKGLIDLRTAVVHLQVENENSRYYSELNRSAAANSTWALVKYAGLIGFGLLVFSTLCGVKFSNALATSAAGTIMVAALKPPKRDELVLPDGEAAVL